MKYTWLQHTTKQLLKHFLLKKQNRHGYSSSDLEKLKRDDLEDLVRRYGTMSEMQKLEEQTLQYLYHQQEQRQQTSMINRDKKEFLLHQASIEFRPGRLVYLFDEYVRTSDRTVHFSPIPTRIVEVSSDYRIVIVEILDKRIWYEAARAKLVPGQRILFRFDPITCKWLRDGLTAEVVRSLGPQNQSIYFQLSYTRQYLLFQHDL